MTVSKTRQKGKQRNGKPAAHLIGKSLSRMHTMQWKSNGDVAFTRKVTHSSPFTTLVTRRKGLYYIYCQVGFTGNATNIGVSLSSKVITLHDPTNENVTLFTGSESITATPSGNALWSTSLSQGGLANLSKGQKLYVHVSHPGLVDYTDGKTFFGLSLLS
ncbi:lymphotoxin-beta [Hyperolius riggenbachi]|uniref:lymphotoxin-beta n=1 Tax=Hyperolius riggenbachi TaxID=752182 RepID=UPI0035A390C6